MLCSLHIHFYFYRYPVLMLCSSKCIFTFPFWDTGCSDSHMFFTYTHVILINFYFLTFFYNVYFWFLAALAALYLTLISQSVSQWLSATLEFWHKEWLLRLQTFQTFDQSHVKTKRQKDLKAKRQKDKTTKRQKDKKTKRQKDKKSKRQKEKKKKRQKDKKTER